MSRIGCVALARAKSNPSSCVAWLTETLLREVTPQACANLSRRTHHTGCVVGPTLALIETFGPGLVHTVRGKRESPRSFRYSSARGRNHSEVPSNTPGPRA